MNDWKELAIDNLPPDILTGDYEFISKASKEVAYTFPWLTESHRERLMILANNGEFDYCYRKVEAKALSHEEIMTTDWSILFVGGRVTETIYERPVKCKLSDGKRFYFINNVWHNSEWFINHESADFPPETE